MTKTLEISDDLYNAVQQLKEVFGQMTGNTALNDEEVLGILVGGFLQSLNEGQYHDEHHHHDGECCGGHDHGEDHECCGSGNCGNKKSSIITD